MRVVGLAVFLLSIPLFLAWARAPLRQRRWAWFAMGFLPFTVGAFHLDVSVISWAMWPGYVKGMIVSLLDSLALALIVTTREPVRGRPLLWPYLMFFVGSTVSAAFASPAMASLFFSWQTARVILVFVAVSKVAARPEGTRWIVGGLASGIIIQAGFCLWQRLHGVTQATGTMGHQNLLGMATHFALLLCVTAILAGDRRTLIKLGAIAAIMTVALTGSRATTGLAAIGLVALVFLSLMRRTSALKIRVALIGGLALLVAAPVALGTLHNRFGAESMLGTAEPERQAFERAANAMWSDHPMGVGANQYVVVANSRGYSERAGVNWNSASRATNVHNTYLLLGAETGYLGLGSFLVLLLTALYVSARTAWARPRQPSGEYALGALVVTIIVAFHSLYEWIFVVWIVQTLFAITLGLVAGSIKQNAFAGNALLLNRRKDNKKVTYMSNIKHA